MDLILSNSYFSSFWILPSADLSRLEIAKCGIKWGKKMILQLDDYFKQHCSF